MLTFQSVNKMSQLNRFKLFGTTPSHSESILPKKISSYSAYITAKNKSCSPVNSYIESVPPANDTS